MVGIARKNEKCAAARLLAPKRLLDDAGAASYTPGIIARHCAKAIVRYIGSGKCRGIVLIRIEIELIDPQQDRTATISEKHNTHGLNKNALM